MPEITTTLVIEEKEFIAGLKKADKAIADTEKSLEKHSPTSSDVSKFSAGRHLRESRRRALI